LQASRQRVTCGSIHLRQKIANQAIAAVQGRYKCRTSVVGALRLSAERAETVDKAEGTSSLERSSVHVPVPQWCASGSSCRNETGHRRIVHSLCPARNALVLGIEE
jgi:hypothetical protein